MGNTFTTWKKYWTLFDRLIGLLTTDNQVALAKSFKESQLKFRIDYRNYLMPKRENSNRYLQNAPISV
jgi:hypothetical protein